jgi:signal transduction histidine kinase
LLDVTERNAVGRRLAERLKLERLVADISGGFVNLPFEDIDGQICTSLQMLLDRLGVERARLALLDNVTDKVILSQYYRADSSETVFVETDDMDRDMPEYAALIRQNRTIRWPSAADVPETLPTVRRFFAERSVCSHLSIPMTVGQDHVGALMITNQRSPLSIDEDLLGYLRVIADTLANALVRRRAEQARERLMRQLRAKNDELASLVHIASHDLRSPLVNIRGFSGELEKSLIELRDLLNAQSLSEPVRHRVDALFRTDVAEAFGFINSGAAKMEAMLNGLLRLSRIGAAPGKPQHLEMGTLLEQVIRQFKYILKAEQITIDVDRDLPGCTGDALLISQVFSNLIDNAIKYRIPSRRLHIRIEGAIVDQGVEYRVIDNGIGIAPEHIQKVFEIFHQLNPSSHENDGQGLGLTIVRKIVEIHDGRVWIESSPDVGTTVRIRLAHR